MNRADITQETEQNKREILQPYLEDQQLEGRVIVYKEKYAGFVVISDVEMTEKDSKQVFKPRSLDQLYEHHKHIEGSRWKMAALEYACVIQPASVVFMGWNIWRKPPCCAIEEIYLSKGKPWPFTINVRFSKSLNINFWVKISNYYVKV